MWENKGMKKQFPGIFHGNSPWECGAGKGEFPKNLGEILEKGKNKQGKIPQIPVKNQSHKFKIPDKNKRGKIPEIENSW